MTGFIILSETHWASNPIVIALTVTVVTSIIILLRRNKAKLPDIMKAKRKPLEVFELGDLGIEVENDILVKNYIAPPARSRGIMVEDAAQLVSELKQRGLV